MAVAQDDTATVVDALIADATLTADFTGGGADISGQMTNWHGIQDVDGATSLLTIIDNAVTDPSTLDQGSGIVAIVGTMTGPQDTLQLAGSVELNGITYGVSGPVAAGFVGNDADYFALVGSEAYDASKTPDFTRDGVARGGLLLGALSK